METLGRYGGATWFNLGDRDLGTHLYRTARLARGRRRCREVTAEIAAGVGPRRSGCAGHRRPRCAPCVTIDGRRRAARSGSRSTSCSGGTTSPVHGRPLRRRRRGPARARVCSTAIDERRVRRDRAVEPAHVDRAGARRAAACATRCAARRDRVGRRVADRRRRRAEGPGRPPARRARARADRRRRGPSSTRRSPPRSSSTRPTRRWPPAVEATGLRCVVAPTVMSTPGDRRRRWPTPCSTPSRRPRSTTRWRSSRSSASRASARSARATTWPG